LLLRRSFTYFNTPSCGLEQPLQTVSNFVKATFDTALAAHAKVCS
jgi:hypothetical protein